MKKELSVPEKFDLIVELLNNVLINIKTNNI